MAAPKANGTTDKQNTQDELSDCKKDFSSLPDYDVALHGMKLMMNNGVDEARDFFYAYRHESALLHSGYSFVTVMRSFLSFEDFDTARAALKETEDLCSKNAVFQLSLLNNRPNEEINNYKYEDTIHREIITADTLLFKAMLASVNQDIKGYIKAGLYLRKAWNHYEKLYKQLSTMSHNNETPSPKNQKTREVIHLTKDTASRLLAAVCFGYGCFQLGLSLIPEKVLRIMEFFGFESDREQALSYLEISSQSRDVKAPLSMMTIIWYHIYLRPFFALDGTNFIAGISDAEKIMAQHGDEYLNSALFLFIKARVWRLKRQTLEAMSEYEKALKCINGQKELGYLCMYEIAWLHCLNQKWDLALESFNILFADTKWSKCFYQYIIALCYGCNGNFDQASEAMRNVPACMKRKNNQLEQFMTKRSLAFKHVSLTYNDSILLMLEMVFLWRIFPTCNTENLRSILLLCNRDYSKTQLPLKCLIEGAVYKELGDAEMAQQCLKEAIARFEGPKNELHVVAFAKYELALFYITNGSTLPLAKPLLQQIKGMGDFCFDQRLSICIQNVLKEIAKKSK